MNVQSVSPRGDAQCHIEAARDWLCRAEKQFRTGQSIMGAATLMLAQAEMKLAVEGVGTQVSIPDTDYPKPTLRLNRMGKTAFTAIAFAACLIFGIFLGHAINPYPSDNAIPRIADSGQSISSIPGQPGGIPSTEILQPTTGEEGSVPTESAGITAVESMGTSDSSAEKSVESGNRPSAKPSGISHREPAGIPVAIPETRAGISETQSDESAEVSSPSSSEEISPAEVTLRTIRALAERLAGKTE